MKNLLVVAVVAAVAVGTPAWAGVTLSVSDASQLSPAGLQNLTLDLVFTNDGATEPLVGFDVAFLITGPDNKLSITGSATGAGRPANQVFASDAAFYTDTSTGGTLYAFSDLLLSGSGSIASGTLLLRLNLQAQAGALGDYHVDFYSNPASAFDSKLYSNANLDLVPGLSLDGGTVTFTNVPEPASLGLLGLGGLGLLRRRR